MSPAGCGGSGGLWTQAPHRVSPRGFHSPHSPLTPSSNRQSCSWKCVAVLLSDATICGLFSWKFGTRRLPGGARVAPATSFLNWELSLVGERSASCRCTECFGVHGLLPQPGPGQHLCKVPSLPAGSRFFCLLGKAVQPGPKRNCRVICFQVSLVAGSSGWPSPEVKKPSGLSSEFVSEVGDSKADRPSVGPRWLCLAGRPLSQVVARQSCSQL